MDASGGDTVCSSTVMESSITDASLKHCDKPAVASPVVMVAMEDSRFSFCSQIVVGEGNLHNYMEPNKHYKVLFQLFTSGFTDLVFFSFMNYNIEIRNHSQFKANSKTHNYSDTSVSILKC